MNFESNKGKILQVYGLINPEDLGFTLPHEHFYVDLRKNHQLPEDLTKSEFEIILGEKAKEKMDKALKREVNLVQEKIA